VAVGDEVEVIEDYRLPHFDRGTIEVVKILRVPESEKFPNGVKYRMHYGHIDGEDDPIVRYDNSHGYHEKHVGDDVEEIDFPGVSILYARFRDHLPDD
jgi:hypothetical protein